MPPLECTLDATGGRAMSRLADPESLLRWWRERSELDRLVETVIETMDGGNLSGMGRALEEFEEALEAHFTLEEKVYFPLIEQFSPPHRGVVEMARLSHQRIRDAINDVRELVGNGQIAAGSRALFVMLDCVRTHESEETKLILDLEDLAGESAD
jgi:hypothetical protein